MNKAILNRRNRERKAKRREREDLNKVGISPDTMPASKRPKSEERSNMTGSGRASDVGAFGRPSDEVFVSSKDRPVERGGGNVFSDVGIGARPVDEIVSRINEAVSTLSPEAQKKIEPKVAAVTKEVEKEKEKETKAENVAVSSAVEDLLKEEPVADDIMEFMVDEPVDAPVDDSSQVDRLSSMFASGNLFSGASPVQAGAIQESAARAGLDGPVDEETQAELDAADLMEEIRVLEGLGGTQAAARLMDIYEQLEAERQKPTSRAKQGSSELINRRTGDLFYFPSLFKGRRGVLNTIYVDQILNELRQSPTIRRLTARRPALGMRNITAR